MFETRTTFWHINSAVFGSYWYCIFFLKNSKKLEFQWWILSQTMSNSNTLDFIGYFFMKKTCSNRFTIFEILKEYSLEKSKTAVSLSNPDTSSKFSFVSWCLDVRLLLDSWFSKKKQISFRNQYYAQYYRVVVFHLLLNSVATIVAAGAQYSISLANWAWYLIKRQS